MAKSTVFGFTLLEVMIALAVIAIAFAALLKGVSSYGVNASYLRDKTFAQWVAMNQLTRYQIEASWPAPDSSQRGTETLANETWQWQANISATFNDHIRRITLTVQRNHEELVVLEGFLAQPAALQ